ncbi:hypothetical protein [Marichromatium bheemlicum]|uniref:Secreted protein n=1 Tax=Marichromatium bheemlicum TaxID=365339 RepID=A0ABX1I632_9GAMM|nr:hypothetical protein [Marichromatium bheemlicum]NKN31692.1 hypothetical protein [Marichromatium bheemlicum]
MKPIRALLLPLCLVAADAAATMTLEEIDTELRLIEAQLRAAEVVPARPSLPTVPVSSSAPVERCQLSLQDLRDEQAALVAVLPKKQVVVERLSASVTELRQRLLREGCGEDDRDRLEALQRDVEEIALEPAFTRVTQLGDCVSERILDAEAEKQAAIARGEHGYGLLGITQRIDALNDLSEQVMQLAIDLEGVVDLRQRLGTALGEYQNLCTGADF